MLKLNNVSIAYGNIKALHSISLTVLEGEIVAIIGANGAGKTSTLRAISGLHELISGDIKFGDHLLNNLRPYQIASLGVIQVLEGRRIFPGLTVEENLEMGTCSWRGLRKTDLSDDLDKVFTLFPRLKERRKQLSWQLSGGEQQMLVVGRALMARPKLLLMDEPSLGLAPILVRELYRVIEEINQMGVTILLVEQNAYMALEISCRGYVLENGNITIQGESKNLLNNSQIKKAYLGG